MPALEQDAEFLDSNPPHWAANGLGWFVLLIVLLATIAIIVLRVPETVTGRFTLLPVTGVDPVRALREGVVSRVATSEGAVVAHRAPLFVLHSTPMGDRAADRRSLETRSAADSTRLTIAASQRQTRRRADEEEIRRLETRAGFLQRLVASKTRRYALSRELADSAASGAQRGSVGRLEAARLEFEASTIAEEIQTAEDELDEVRATVQRIRQDAAARELEFDEIRRSLDESIETARIRIRALGEDLLDLSDSGMVVLSPCAGTVLRLHVSAPGAVVREGEVLAELACSGERLQAELLVPEAGVSMIHAGLPVKLRFDAFPYQRYGVRFGTVRWVGPAGASRADSSAFRALIDLADSSVVVRGAARPLLAGMGGFGEVVVGRRSLASYAFEPVRALKENFREPPR